MSAWQSIRLLRARPPVPVTGERLGVFVSALEQAEQLMRAARDVGPAARPLPLFYALSQAGRAITAAKLLQEFVADVPWVHLDIAGPAWAEHDSASQDAGGTGCFVRTLVELARLTEPS